MTSEVLLENALTADADDVVMFFVSLQCKAFCVVS